MAQSLITTDSATARQLQGAFAQGLGLDPAMDFAGVAYGSTPGWDSVAHMSLVAEIETTFDIMLDTDDVIAMSSFEKAVEIVGKYGIRIGA